jgi:hypothetical protein
MQRLSFWAAFFIAIFCFLCPFLKNQNNDNLTIFGMLSTRKRGS